MKYRVTNPRQHPVIVGDKTCRMDKPETVDISPTEAMALKAMGWTVSPYDEYQTQTTANPTAGSTFVSMTQAQYNALATKDPKTLYLIIEG